MTKSKPLPALEVLQEYFEYNSETGICYWKKSPAKNTKAWTVAGTKKSDYWVIRFQNSEYQAHRIFWYLHFKEDPGEDFVDHIDRNKYNNRISNLRIANDEQNQMNLEKAKSNNKTGVLGVCWDKRAQRYKAYITVNKTKKNLGNYKTLEEAAAVRQAAVKQYFGDFAPQSNFT
jgi:hypothetical protein